MWAEDSETAVIDAFCGPLVRRGLVHILDDVILNGTSLRLEFQSKLLFDGIEDRRQVLHLGRQVVS